MLYIVQVQHANQENINGEPVDLRKQFHIMHTKSRRIKSCKSMVNIHTLASSQNIQFREGGRVSKDHIRPISKRATYGAKYKRVEFRLL